MDRSKLIKKVEKKIESKELYNIDKDCVRENFSNKKNGIYFLYNQNNEVIYVGKVGNGRFTSFYRRLYGHGSGAHNRKDWFKEVKNFRFKSFCKLNDKQLNQIERLMIFAKNQPAYNDCYITEEEVSQIYDKLCLEDKCDENI